MHIKEIEIDGFKSYAQKQVCFIDRFVVHHRTLQIVGKFDDQFNAITGLNGSGKSNILDSICFVLGISNLQHIRAQSNNDLIFKQGNAGITKVQTSMLAQGHIITSYRHKSRSLLIILGEGDSLTNQISLLSNERYVEMSNSLVQQYN